MSAHDRAAVRPGRKGTKSGVSVRRNEIALSPYLWLAVGALLWAAYTPGSAVPAAAWLAPVFLLRFSRRQRPAVGLPILALTFVAIEVLTDQGLQLLWGRGLNYVLMCALAGLPWVLPFLGDRLIAPRLGGYASTLVFPAAYATYEYLNALFSPAGSMGSLAYTQWSLPLLQVVSVTGMWGLTFLLAWFASVLNWAWERGFAPGVVGHGLGLYAGALAAVLLLGGARLAFFAPQASTVRVASIVTPYALNDYPFPSAGASWEPFRRASARVQQRALDLSLQAAASGAQVVFWREGAVMILEEDKEAFIEACRQVARETGVYLGASLGSISRDFPREYGANTIVWIDPAGQVLFTYHKARLVPGEPFVPGDGKLSAFDSPYGRIASPICFDLDFPTFIQQAGRADVDILLIPANDWQGVTPAHTHMAALRAIEQGVSVVKATSYGRSAAFDYQGRVLSAADTLAREERVLFSDVPTRGTRTLYARTGDAFAWLCAAGLVVMAGQSLLAARGHRAGNAGVKKETGAREN
jgi:apolipoprotein N-acyltransferase